MQEVAEIYHYLLLGYRCRTKCIKERGCCGLTIKAISGFQGGWKAAKITHMTNNICSKQARRGSLSGQGCQKCCMAPGLGGRYGMRQSEFCEALKIKSTYMSFPS